VAEFLHGLPCTDMLRGLAELCGAIRAVERA
jgi:hypothetical protein